VVSQTIYAFWPNWRAAALIRKDPELVEGRRLKNNGFLEKTSEHDK
jgi:hypothetical protein